VLVSNRIPLSFERTDGHLAAKPASGGLVTALEPVLTEHGGVWVGSVEAEDSPELRTQLENATRDVPFQYAPVNLSREEVANYYEGFSNEVLWPLFHDLQSRCVFNPIYWDFYQSVNRKFAEAALAVSSQNDLVWVQDYQLLLVAPFLRERRPDGLLSFFLHIPFPSPDIFAKLPWRRQVLQSLLAYDFIGLQTARDERNLVRCIRSFAPDVKVIGRGDHRKAITPQRTVSIAAVPISIDFVDFAENAQIETVRQRAHQLREENPARQIALGVDRLDYTKGIPERLRALAAFFGRYPEARGKLTFIQLVVPSRENIPGYQELLAEIERQASSINGKFAEAGWTPVQYIHRSIDREELLALYGAAHIALITPLKDGMNLVAKEYCAAHVDNDGVLVLSEFAGAMPELRTGAICVHPYDEMGIANAIKQAFDMPAGERHRRMLQLRGQIRKSDIRHWRDRIFTRMQQLRFPTGAGVEVS
jgi:trehalose 6-phosphate synthase